VRLEEIQVKLIGVKTDDNSAVKIRIENNGDFRDSYGDQVYNFTSAPLVRGFTYYPHSGKFNRYIHLNYIQCTPKEIM
jgi:hypothetical protein